MTAEPLTRRRTLGALGGGLAGLASLTALAGCTSGDDRVQTPQPTSPQGDSQQPIGQQVIGDDGPEGWQAVESPTDAALNAVATTRDGPYAVGEDGVLVGRCSGVWEVVAEGLGDATDAFNGADVTANGRHLWFAGSSGALGLYDLDEGVLADFSAPLGKTSTWTDVSVAGLAGKEWLHVVNGSGEILRGQVGDGAVTWNAPSKPGTGSTLSTVHFIDRGTGFLTDTNGRVYQTTDGGGEWRQMGISAASGTLSDVSAQDPDSVTVAGDGGRLFRYNGFDWTVQRAGEAPVRAVARDEQVGLATTASGTVYEWDEDEWTRSAQPADVALDSVVLGSATDPDVAVGANGTIVERVR